MHSILLNQELTYCLTYDDFNRLISMVNSNLEVPFRIEALVPSDLGCLNHVKGLVICHPLVPLERAPISQVFYMMGNPDIKDTVEALLKYVPLRMNGCFERSSYMLRYLKAGSTCVTGTQGVVLSFELFNSIDDLAKHFDWLMPTVIYASDSVYISCYSMECLKGGTLLASSHIKTFAKTPCYTNFWNTYNDIEYDEDRAYCSYCQNTMYPFGLIDLGFDYDPSHEYISEALLGAKCPKTPYTLTSDKWDSEYFDPYYVGYYLPNHSPEGLKRLAGNPKYKGLEHLLKPLKLCYVEPIPYDEALCPVCELCYKPVWSLKRAHFYKDLSVLIYLVISKYGIPWDLVLLITELHVNSGHYQTFKGLPY